MNGDEVEIGKDTDIDRSIQIQIDVPVHVDAEVAIRSFTGICSSACLRDSEEGRSVVLSQNTVLWYQVMTATSPLFCLLASVPGD